MSVPSIPYKVDAGRSQISFSFQNVSEVDADKIVSLSSDIFKRLYDAGINGNSCISLEVKQGFKLDRTHPMGSLYTLQVPAAPSASGTSISHAYAFLDRESEKGFLCFYLTGKVDEGAVHGELQPHLMRVNPETSLIRRIIACILSFGCIKFHN